jgi:serine/threonine-protein kinase
VIHAAQGLSDGTGDAGTSGLGGGAAIRPPGPSLGATLPFDPGRPPSVQLRDLPGEEPHLVNPASPELPVPAGATAGRYLLRGEIARGGMGAILNAHDLSLGSDLVLKVLLEAYRDKPELVRRFVEEAQIGGQLQHPGIVPVFELGRFPAPDGRPYFAMKLVRGQSLGRLFERRPDPAHELPRYLAIFQAVCQAVAYAHARGVIHRDLKPSNVMVGSFGEVYVADWGLAKVLARGDGADEAPLGRDGEPAIQTVRSEPGSGLESEPGTVLGTPAYMAPEQARGEVKTLDERCDVFGLGAILCEILTGAPPFEGAAPLEIRERAARGDLAGAMERLDGCGADAELIGLAQHCLAAAREDRPRDAGEVADRVEAYLAESQERARRAELERAEAQARAEEEAKRRGLADELARQAQARAEQERAKRRLTMGLAASLLAFAGLGGGGWTWMERQRLERAARVDLAFNEAEVLRDEAKRAGDDLGRWIAARDAAHAVERLLADARDARTRGRVAALVQEVDKAIAAAKADRELLEKLVDIRSAEADDPDGSASDAAYARAFREVGIDVDDLGAEMAATRIKARPAGVPLALAAAIDDWAVQRRKARPKDADGWMRLVGAARGADPDPQRDQLRQIWSQPDRKAQREPLRELARGADPQGWPVQSLDLLASVLAEAGDRDAAVALLRRAQAHHPGDVWINYDLGRFLEALHPPRVEEAIRFYSAARALRPETGHELAHALDGRGHGDEALMVFEELTRLRLDNSRHWTCLGRLLRERGDRVGAEAALERAVATARETVHRNPEDDWARFQLATTLLALGKPVEASSEYREAIRLKPNSSDAHSNLGVALYDQGKFDEAIAEYREVLRLRPEDASAYVNLGNALSRREKFAEAVTAYSEAIRLNRDFARVHYCLGLTLNKLGTREEAITEFRETIRIKPDFAEAHRDLGLALNSQGKRDEAMAEFREAIRLKPTFFEAHIDLGVALHDHGKFDAAIVEYREAIRLEPGEAHAHNNLGTTLLRQGKLNEAIAAYRKAIVLKPDHVMAHVNLGNALCDQGKLDEAIAECREAIRLNPQFAGAHNNLGNALTSQGKLAEAVDAYREAIRLKPDDAKAHNYLDRRFTVEGP